MHVHVVHAILTYSQLSSISIIAFMDKMTAGQVGIQVCGRIHTYRALEV